MISFITMVHHLIITLLVGALAGYVYGDVNTTCATTGTQIATYDGTAFNPACLCYSQYSGASCSDFTTAIGCTNSSVVADISMTGQQTLKGGINGAMINGVMDTVEFQIDSPQVTTRQYLSFNWGKCDTNNATSNTPLKKFVSNTDQTSCDDSFSFGYLVSELQSTCGIDKGNFMYDPTNTAGIANDSWVRYRGDHIINYRENVTLTLNGGYTNQTFERTGRLVTPIDIYILRGYQAELSTNNTMFVYSTFQLKAAITATQVKANATTAYVEVTFGLSNPYEISYIGNEYAPGQPGVAWKANNGVADIANAFVVDSNGNAITGAINNTQSFLGSCQPADYDASGFCWRKVRVMIVTATACTLDHTFTFNTIAVDCNPQYAGADCPLSVPDDTSSASFTVTAADFCDGQRAMVINGAITLLAYVPQRILNRADSTATLRSYAIDDYAWLTLFIDAAKSLKVFKMEAVAFQTKIDNGNYTTPPDAAAYISATNAGTPGQDGSVQGFDVATQTHAMNIQLDCNFVTSIDNGPPSTCLVKPSNDRAQIYAQLTFLVDYEGARRRRRQADSTSTAGQRGYASMESNMAVQPEEGAAVDLLPSSAPAMCSSMHLVALVAGAAGTALLF